MKFQVIVSDPAWSFSDKLKMSDVKRGAASQYRTLSIQDIKDLKVKDLADPNGAVLALWVPSSLLQEGLDTMKSWGFKHKQTYIWVKTKKNPLDVITSVFFKFWKHSYKEVVKLKGNKFTNYIYNSLKLMDFINPEKGGKIMGEMLAFGMGRLFRQTHEICLIGVNSSKIYKKLKNKSQRSVSFAPNLKHSSKPEHLQDALEIMFPGASKLEMFARRVRPDWTCIGNEVCNGEDIRDSLAKLI